MCVRARTRPPAKHAGENPPGSWNAESCRRHAHWLEQGRGGTGAALRYESGEQVGGARPAVTSRKVCAGGATRDTGSDKGCRSGARQNCAGGMAAGV